MNGARQFTSNLLNQNSDANEAVKITNSTSKLLRCFMFFDICWLVSGIALIVMALTNHNDPRVIMLGGAVGVYAAISSLVNSLANHGMRTWKRGFLLPWLTFYLIMFLFLITQLTSQIVRMGLIWRHIFWGLASFAIFSCWRHMLKQYKLMTKPRPQQQIVVDVESMVRELTASREQAENDTPPKYEELDFPSELPPPQYSSCVLEVIKEEELPPKDLDQRSKINDPKKNDE